MLSQATMLNTTTMRLNSATVVRPGYAARPFTRIVVKCDAQKSGNGLFGDRQGPSDAYLKFFAVAAAAQLAVLPFAGTAFAKPSDGNEPPIVSATRQASDAQKEFLPEGAFNDKVREDRNTKISKGIEEKYDTIKSRISTEGARANNAYGEQNIFDPKNLNKATSWVSGPLRVTNVGLDPPRGSGGASRDLESNYGGENSVGEAVKGSDPKKGGDLKDSANEFAAEFQVDKRNDTAAFGSGTPKKPVSISEKEQKIPNFIGGPGFLRDDNITPEQAAQDNIATAKAGAGSILDSVK